MYGLKSDVKIDIPLSNCVDDADELDNWIDQFEN